MLTLVVEVLVNVVAEVYGRVQPMSTSAAYVKSLSADKIDFGVVVVSAGSINRLGWILVLQCDIDPPVAIVALPEFTPAVRNPSSAAT